MMNLFYLLFFWAFVHVHFRDNKCKCDITYSVCWWITNFCFKQVAVKEDSCVIPLYCPVSLFLPHAFPPDLRTGLKAKGLHVSPEFQNILNENHYFRELMFILFFFLWRKKVWVAFSSHFQEGISKQKVNTIVVFEMTQHSWLMAPIPASLPRGLVGRKFSICNAHRFFLTFLNQSHHCKSPTAEPLGASLRFLSVRRANEMEIMSRIFSSAFSLKRKFLS